ncbi:DinB family protein [Pontibacillus yanchengensis]|uniref:DinB family protein n=1 Tax=Pontibacillus yanchengensis TaxID=462910 RepID=A0ACC7VJM8_9BACI|nr:DinB family protein [Pontibacillus yanchengensis]MYL54379.1 DinB family protein [Pontibacillus yanchengensis]
MKEEMIFKQMEFVRTRTLKALEATTEDQADVIPEGFNNSIRWNFGHILVNHENLLAGFLQKEKEIPSHYIDLFNARTSPIDWQTDPPSLDELRMHLSQQVEAMRTHYQGRLEEERETPFTLGSIMEFSTLGELFTFSNWHEGLHQGAITSLKRAQGIEKS